MSMITSKRKDGVLTIGLSGQITVGNAAQLEKEINEACDANEHTDLVLDLENLEYTSSAGMRVLHRLCKKEPNLCLIHTPDAIYDTFEMTGFVTMMPIFKGEAE